MAVKKKEEVKVVVEKPKVKEEVKVDIQPKKVVEELKRVKPNASFHTNIGGQNYYFEKGVCSNVPENVKRILMEGNMLLPL